MCHGKRLLVNSLHLQRESPASMTGTLPRSKYATALLPLPSSLI